MPSPPPAPTRPSPARAALVAALSACTVVLAACGEPVDSAADARLAAERRAVPGGDAARGRELLDRYQCGSCHSVPGAMTTGVPYAPPLTAWGGRSTLAGVLTNDGATLVRWLQDPPALVPGTRMPRLGVGEADARDLAAALMAMR